MAEETRSQKGEERGRITEVKLAQAGRAVGAQAGDKPAILGHGSSSDVGVGSVADSQVPAKEGSMSHSTTEEGLFDRELLRAASDAITQDLTGEPRTDYHPKTTDAVCKLYQQALEGNGHGRYLKSDDAEAMMKHNLHMLMPPFQRPVQASDHVHQDIDLQLERLCSRVVYQLTRESILRHVASRIGQFSDVSEISESLQFFYDRCLRLMGVPAVSYVVQQLPDTILSGITLKLASIRQAC